MMFAYAETITLLRTIVSGVDEYGNDVLDDVELRVPGCAIWPSDSNGAGGNEDTNARDLVISGYTVLCREGTDVRATDRVKLPNDTGIYEVVGRPGVWRNPLSGSRSGVQISVRLVTG